jgi:hypothetical protein
VLDVLKYNPHSTVQKSRALIQTNKEYMDNQIIEYSISYFSTFYILDLMLFKEVIFLYMVRC